MRKPQAGDVRNPASNALRILLQPLGPLTPLRRKRRLSKRDAWLRNVDVLGAFNDLFDLLPAVYVFVKNRRSEMMFVSRGWLKTFHITDDAAAIGLTDFDLTPTTMSEGYRKDDAAVLNGGGPLLGRVELWFDRQGLPEWFMVHKLPLRSRTGRIVGIIGFLQDYQASEKTLPAFQAMAEAVAFMRQNYHEPLSIRNMARRTALSPRQFERKFKAIFGVRAQEFLIKTRVQAAARLLRESNHTLPDVALACGFCDQRRWGDIFADTWASPPPASDRAVPESDVSPGIRRQPRSFSPFNSIPNFNSIWGRF